MSDHRRWFARAVGPALALVTVLIGHGCGGPAPVPAAPTGDGSAALPDLGDETITPAAVRDLADQACPRIDRPYFWKIESRSGGPASYLLGSMHIGIDPAKLPAAVVDALGESALVVLETDPALDAAEDSDGGAQDGFSLPDGAPGLDAQLGPELWQRYLTIMGGTFPSPAVAARLTPAVATILLSALYLDKSVALDGTLGTMAIERGLPTRGLETPAFQEAILAKWMDIRALRSAVRTIESRRQMHDDARREIADYCAGVDDSPGMDPGERAEMIATGYAAAELDEFEHDLLWSRNSDWVAPLTAMFDVGDAFVIVGADHLRGQRGVITLLQQVGFSATRIVP